MLCERLWRVVNVNVGFTLWLLILLPISLIRSRIQDFKRELGVVYLNLAFREKICALKQLKMKFGEDGQPHLP